MRLILLLFTLSIITFKASSQEAIESTSLSVQDIELHSETPVSEHQKVNNVTHSETQLTRIIETTEKVEYSVISPLEEDEGLIDSDQGMAGVFRVVGVACATFIGCLVGLGGTIWICLKGKKAIEQSIN